MIYVIGGRGRLGRAIEASCPRGEVVVLDRATYQDWWRDDAGASITRFFRNAEPGSSVFVTAGLLDPAVSEAEHTRVNFQLPAHIIESACQLGLRVITFGTVMERLVEHPNPYVASKAALGRFVADQAATGRPVTHLQIHTLYGGGEPAPFMFLGQLYGALREGTPFEMSPGRQLREYHHIDDDVAALSAMLNAGAIGVVHLSHGEPCSLRELAQHIFAALGQPELLRLGVRPEPAQDNYSTILSRSQGSEQVSFRPALEGVTDFLRALLSSFHREHEHQQRPA
ncbi:NAD(P)-dependent oxidoreductase [Variovorax rhizosphaerae]|uniref:NAD(P)-dependent oxidoreductase n=1 Tax=Variovorax rhizosphaerae TaxID=1836200 RepID=A0ABU8WI99_9BURK